jgi:hypothetical protein
MFRVATPVAVQVLAYDVTYHLHVRFLRVVLGLLKNFSYFFFWTFRNVRKSYACVC